MALVAFDFDGTLSAEEMTVLLGRRVGAESEMAAITERAMRGELEYAESLRTRVALLAGISLSEVERTLEDVHLRSGATDLLRALAAQSVATAVLTGGFERGVRAVLEREGVEVDRLVANRLDDDGESLTGTVDGPLVEGTKDEVLTTIASDLGVPMTETVAVGDGANDRPMLVAAGYAIGYEPKPAVAAVVDETVTSMAALQRLLGQRDVLTC